MLNTTSMFSNPPIMIAQHNIKRLFICKIHAISNKCGYMIKYQIVVGTLHIDKSIDLYQNIWNYEVDSITCMKNFS
jgi:hypothetical protein